MHEGCAARVWLALRTDAPATLPAGAAGQRHSARRSRGSLPVDVHEAGGTVVETTADIVLNPARNEIPLHSWGDASLVPARGQHLGVPRRRRPAPAPSACAPGTC